jgi:hypothetical protein
VPHPDQWACAVVHCFLVATRLQLRLEDLTIMQKLLVDEKDIRRQLKSKRDLLFEEYSKNPMKSRLAIEIKPIDDQIAELTERHSQPKKSGSK